MNLLKISGLSVVFLVLAAEPAQALECIAGVRRVDTFRAEGETELIGSTILRCRGPRAAGASDELTFGTSVPTKLEVSITLNAAITNELNASGMIERTSDSLGYNDSRIRFILQHLDANQELGALIGTQSESPLSDGAVSDDLRTVTWKHADSDPNEPGIQFDPDTFQLAVDGNGFQLRIVGLRVDASAVGDGGEITAEVTVNGATVKGSPLTLASVKNGLEVSVKAAKGDECADVDASATITLKEGFNRSAFFPDDSFLITFRNIPEGVTVMVPEKVDLLDDDPGTNADEELGSILLELVEGRPGDGVGKPEGGKAMVELTATGTGSVRYTIGRVSAGLADDPNTPADESLRTLSTVRSADVAEKADLPVYFSWSGGDVVMKDDAMVYVSFSPVGGDAMPRFVGDGEPDAILKIEDCVQKLTFPFVTTQQGFDTGIFVSNTNDASGTCTASYSGSEDTVSSPVIEGNDHWTFLVSSHGMTDYSGRLMVKCDFGGIDGFAHISDAEGNAQGYLPRMKE